MGVSFAISFKVVFLFVICFIQYSLSSSDKSGSLPLENLEYNSIERSTQFEDSGTMNGTFTESSSTTLSSTSAPPTHSRRFDAPSFIGGIALTYGFIALMYVGFRFYKAHVQKNYNNM
ncbi:uncharacterized protein LOC143250717 [Tachypleus tridentatus]|uniref:uncharacterized protein LOC143250717 n=1 Tax=Tachypleus tridentatus TaxID=6853 RepID=UPI003FD6A3AD